MQFDVGAFLLCVCAWYYMKEKYSGADHQGCSAQYPSPSTDSWRIWAVEVCVSQDIVGYLGKSVEGPGLGVSSIAPNHCKDERETLRVGLHPYLHIIDSFKRSQ